MFVFRIPHDEKHCSYIALYSFFTLERKLRMTEANRKRGNATLSATGMGAFRAWSSATHPPKLLVDGVVKRQKMLPWNAWQPRNTSGDT